MSEQHPYRAEILSVPEGISRPLWSVMIPTYNCANYLRETLVSVLAQDPGAEQMQIEVVDDCSTQDDPEAIVKEIGKGRVSFYRQPQNVGHIKNFNTCLQRSRGKLIHLLHGDDWIKEGFYQKLERGFQENADIGAAFCSTTCVNYHEQNSWISSLGETESGVLSNWLEKIAVQNLITPPSIVVKRTVYEKLGRFDSRICCGGEDWEMWIRIAANYPVWYEIESLAFYRIHYLQSLTGRCTRTGQFLRDLYQIIQLTESYIPQPLASTLSKQAKEHIARTTLEILINRFLAQGDLTAINNLIKEFLRFDFSLKSIMRSIRFELKILKNYFRQAKRLCFNTLFKSL
jgi:glycosyltransferase involved in cell wall biosynthesis